MIGSRGYICDDNGLAVIDVSNPVSPALMGGVPTADYAWGDVAAAGNYAYVAVKESGLHVVDVSNPGSPVVVGEVDTPGNPLGVAVLGSYAYVAANESGLHVIDVSNPASPTIVGTVDTPVYAGGGVAVSGSHVYIAAGVSGLQVIDVSNPTAPLVVGSAEICTLRSSRCDSRGGLCLRGDTGSVVRRFGSSGIQYCESCVSCLCGRDRIPGSSLWHRVSRVLRVSRGPFSYRYRRVESGFSDRSGRRRAPGPGEVGGVEIAVSGSCVYIAHWGDWLAVYPTQCGD